VLVGKLVVAHSSTNVLINHIHIQITTPVWYRTVDIPAAWTCKRHLQVRCLWSSQHQLAGEMLPWLLKNSGSRYTAIMHVTLGSSGKIKVNLWSGCRSSDSTITSASSSKLPDSGSLPFYSPLRLHLNIRPFVFLYPYYFFFILFGK